jgi:DNA-binding CsgD family transcriptional regulator
MCASYERSSTNGYLADPALIANFEAMSRNKLNEALAAGVLAIAVFNTLSGLSQPGRDHPPSPWFVALWAVLLVVHAMTYWYASRLRQRFGDARFFGAQTALVFAVGVTGAFFPVSVALYLALTMYAIIVVGEHWGTLTITLGAIAVFALSAIVTSNLYQGSMAGLMLAAAGIVGHAVAALLRRDGSRAVAPDMSAQAPAIPAPAVTPIAGPRVGPDFGLTAREAEILEALTHGARNSEIAERFDIAERTVKAHLARIYEKLGVDSRAAAIAIVLRTGQR